MGSDWLWYLEELGVVDLPSRLRGLGPREVYIYAEIQRREPCVPSDIHGEMDISPGSVYPALDRLEEEGLVERRPAISRHGNATECVTTGPEIVGSGAGSDGVRHRGR